MLRVSQAPMSKFGIITLLIENSIHVWVIMFVTNEYNLSIKLFFPYSRGVVMSDSAKHRQAQAATFNASLSIAVFLLLKDTI